MRYSLLLILPALLPAAFAAPAPPAPRAAFGANGLVTLADLEKVKFDSRLVKADDREKEQDEPAADEVKTKENKVRPANPFDVAVHMPETKFRKGEPIPAYFVLRNNRGYHLQVRARLDLFDPDPVISGSCDLRVRDTKTGKTPEGFRLAGAAHGGYALVSVPPDGFYCVKGDLGALPPGEYEVDWRYRQMRSAPVRFSVLNLDGPKQKPRPKRPSYQFFRVTSEDGLEDEDEGRPFVGPVRWSTCELDGISAEEMAAALAVGGGERVGAGSAFVPDIHTIPAADGLVEAWAEWRPYRDGDRLVVELRAAPPLERVRFAEIPHLYLQLEMPADERPLAEDQPQKAARLEDSMRLVTPLKIEARLPADWRERVGTSGTARVAVLVTARELEFPQPGLRKKLEEIEEERIEGRPPLWRGIVRSDFTELRFPPRLLKP